MNNDAVNRRILDGAKIEFARAGYHRTVVSDVADRAGVGKGTVYRRFGDKKGLFAAMIRQSIRDMEGDLKRVLDTSASPEENLTTLVNVFFGLSDHSRELIEIIITEGTQVMGLEKEKFQQELDGLLQVIEGVLQQGIEQGCFCVKDTRSLTFLLHRFMISVLEGSVFFGYRPQETFGPLMLDVLLNGIRTEQARAQAGAPEGEKDIL